MIFMLLLTAALLSLIQADIFSYIESETIYYKISRYILAALILLSTCLLILSGLVFQHRGRKKKVEELEGDLFNTQETSYYNILKRSLKHPTTKYETFDEEISVCVKYKLLSQKQANYKSILDTSNSSLIKKRTINEFIKILTKTDYILQTKSNEYGFTFNTNYKIGATNFDLFICYREHRIFNKILHTKSKLLDNLFNDYPSNDHSRLIKIYDKPITIADLIELKKSLQEYIKKTYSDNSIPVYSNYGNDSMQIFILGELDLNLSYSLATLNPDFEFEASSHILRDIISGRLDEIISLRMYPEDDDFITHINFIFPNFALDPNHVDSLKVDRTEEPYPVYTNIFSLSHVLQKNVLAQQSILSSTTNDIIQFGSFLPTIEFDWNLVLTNKIKFLMFDFFLNALDKNLDIQYSLFKDAYSDQFDIEQLPKELINSSWEELLKPETSIDYNELDAFIYSRLSDLERTLDEGDSTYFKQKKNFLPPMIDDILNSWSENEVLKLIYSKETITVRNTDDPTYEQNRQIIDSIIVYNNILFDEEFSSHKYEDELSNL